MKFALFPLNTVLFPGSILPLQIFEQRYLNLIKECMKQQTGFVTVLISEGKEVGAAPQVYRVGCYVEIIDWQSLANGLLGISVQAKYRVRLSDSSVRDDGLLFAETTSLESAFDDSLQLPQGFEPLSATLQQLLKHPYAQHYEDKINFEKASDICFRLSELLPISNKHKQLLLESDNLVQMLDQLALHINALQR
jgi:Lon protease-like protein